MHSINLLYCFLFFFRVQCEGPSYISDFVERVVPFVSRLEELQSGSGRQCLSEYMLSIAKVVKVLL